MNPVFTIITPAYNCRAKLAGTVESVLSQSFGQFEYLIMDGNSKDGTSEWAAQIDDPRVRLFSEPDLGIYDAMNKGIALSRGRYLIFLGAGDALLAGALQHVSQQLPQSGVAVIYGNVLWERRIYDGKFSKLKLCRQNICHQAMFYARDVFKIVGKYNLKYQTAADWVFNMQCFGENRIKIRHIPFTVAIFEVGGASGKGDPDFDADKMSLIRNHLGLSTCIMYEFWKGQERLTSRLRQRIRPFVPPIILKAKRTIIKRFLRH